MKKIKNLLFLSILFFNFIVVILSSSSSSSSSQLVNDLHWETIFKINNLNNIKSFLINYNNNTKTNSIITYNDKLINVYDNNNLINKITKIPIEVITTFIDEIINVSIYNNDLYVYGTDKLNILTQSNKKIIEIIKYPYILPTTSKTTPSSSNLKNTVKDSTTVRKTINFNNNKKHGEIGKIKFIIYNDNFYFIDTLNGNQITVINNKDEIQFSFGKNELKNPIELILNSIDNEIIILDEYDNSIYIFNLYNGDLIGKINLFDQAGDPFNLNKEQDDEKSSTSENNIEIKMKSISYDIDNKIIYILSSDNKLVGFKKSKGQNIYRLIKTMDLTNSIDKIIKIESISNKGELLIGSLKNLQLFKWIGPSIINIQFINNRIEINGNCFNSTTNIIKSIYFENDKENQCNDIFIHYDKLISCKYNNIKSKLITNNKYQLNIEFTSISSNSNETNQLLIGNFLFINDGCLEDYIFDEINQVCKKLKENNIKISKCINNNNDDDNLEITRIGNCPNIKGWLELNSSNVDISKNKIIRFQECWFNDNFETKNTEIDVIPSIESNLIIKNKNCKLLYGEPILVDITTFVNLYHLSCIDLYGIKNIVKSNSVPMLPSTCNIKSNNYNYSELEINEIFINKFEPWEIGYSRCLHGSRLKDDLNKCFCDIGSHWMGKQCDIPICDNKIGYELNSITGQCKCNKKCNNETEILDPISCNCLCSLSTPFRCPESNTCSKSFSNCLKSFISNEMKCSSNSSTPFNCVNGKCYSSPSECLASIPECLYKKCCWNGEIISSTSTQITCPTLPSCPKLLPYRCIDGSCKLGLSQCHQLSKSLLIQNQCKLNEICSDGSCPPCPNYDGCSILEPIQCLNGECKSNFTLCNKPSFGNFNDNGYENDLASGILNYLQKDQDGNMIIPTSYIFEPKNNGNQLLPIYIKPISTLVTLESNINKNITIFDTNGKFIADIQLNIPGESSTSSTSSRSNNNNSFPLISIEPVSDSYLRNVLFSPNLSRENAIFSPVLNITLLNYNIETDHILPFIVNITFKMINNFKNLNIKSSNINNFCLGFINTTKNQWECVSSDNNSLLNQLILLNDKDDDSILVKGFTNHFTCFGVLLRGNSNFLNNNYHGDGGDGIDSNDGGDDNKNMSFNISPKILISTIFSVVGLAIIIIISGILFLSYKKHGNFKTLKKVYIERIKYRFSNDSTTTSTTSSSSTNTPSSPPLIGTIIEKRIEKCVGDDDDDDETNNEINYV